MTDDRALERSLERAARSWLEAGPTRAPEHAITAALARIEHTSQERGLRVPRRFRPMSIPARLAAAAVLGAVVVGGAVMIMKSWSAPIAGPTSPSPNATPSAEQSPLASIDLVRVLPESGRIEPGRYLNQTTAVDVEFTVGSGWTSGGYYINTDTSSLSFWIVPKVYADACDLGSAPDTTLGGTVGDLVAALDGQANTDMSPPVEVMIDGHSGVRVQLSPSAGRPESCSVLALWTVSDGGPGRQIDTSGPPGDVEPVWIVDVDGERLVFVAWESKLGDYDPTIMSDVIDSMTLAKR